jgi:hypothetical protein
MQAISSGQLTCCRKQGSRRPWRVYQNYFLDMLITRFGAIADGVLQFHSGKEKTDVKGSF